MNGFRIDMYSTEHGTTTSAACLMCGWVATTCQPDQSRLFKAQDEHRVKCNLEPRPDFACKDVRCVDCTP